MNKIEILLLISITCILLSFVIIFYKKYNDTIITNKEENDDNEDSDFVNKQYIYECLLKINKTKTITTIHLIYPLKKRSEIVDIIEEVIKDANLKWSLKDNHYVEST